MDLWSPGVMPNMVPTAVPYRISCEMCGRSKLLLTLLLQSGVMDLSVVTWRFSPWGGDSRVVQDQLRDVRQIQVCAGAFAAILEDKSVVAWGDANYGGDSSAVQHQLTNVQQIQASYRAFAAILEDKSVVTWGRAALGGDSSAVEDQLCLGRPSGKCNWILLWFP